MRMTARGKRTLYPIAWVVCGNFFAFIAISLFFGGSAGAGQVENGHYFVGNHGQLTEVDPVWWYCSYFHMITAFMGIGILTITFFSLWFSEDIGP